MHNSLVLITNSENKNFGTGFVIRKERNHSYILTCAHVVERTPKSLLVDSRFKAKILYQGSSDGLDLALLKAPIGKEPLSLMETDCEDFQIQGFKKFTKLDHVAESIQCKLDSKVEFRPKYGEPINGWKLSIAETDAIMQGYSGSPLMCNESGNVVGVVNSREGISNAFAIAIENLKYLWADLPRTLIKQKNHIPRVFISAAHREPDITIAQEFAQGLNTLGYRTFLAKTDISFGEHWLERIYDELEECEYFVLLLSKHSLESEMVAEEVKKIKELQSGSAFPIILPIRVNLPFEYNVNYELLKQINKVQQLIWKSSEDTPVILDEIHRVISSDEYIQEVEEELTYTETDIPIPNAPLILEQPTGTVPLDSRFYIEREDDKKCYGTLCEKYSLIRIKAPRQYGKTSLLARLIMKAREEEYHIISFSFQEFDKSLLSDLEELLEYICEMIAFELDIEVSLNAKILKRLTPKTKATKYMEKILLKVDKPIVLAIDEADRLFDYSEISDEFFGLIRAWHENAKSKPVWNKLKILLSHSTEPLLGITSINQSPFHNVGLGIELKPFTKKELQELAYKHNIILTDNELEKFINFIGGHPFLSRKLLYTIVNEKCSLDEIILNAHSKDSIFNDHMRRYLWILKDNDKLTNLLKEILSGNNCNDDASCYILEATGLIHNALNQAQFSCELYREFFSRKL